MEITAVFCAGDTRGAAGRAGAETMPQVPRTSTGMASRGCGDDCGGACEEAAAGLL